MYFLRVETNFSAALYLSNCGDKYKGMHGHDYDVVVILKSSVLSNQGMVYDYTTIQGELNSLAQSFDHVLLNDQAEFLELNPTVEHLAKFFCDKLIQSLPNLPIYEVEVKQSKGVCASYRLSI